MASNTPVALVAALALAFAACGDDDPDAAGSTTTTEVTAQTADDGAGAELADDVAAVVDGVEIGTAGLDEQVEALAANPEIGVQLEGEQGEQLEGLVRAEVLTAAILTQVAVDAADELGRPVTDDDVAAARADLEEQAGGAEALAEAIAGQGLTEASVDVQLRGLAALTNVEAALAERDGAGGTAPTTTEAAVGDAPQLSPEEQAAQEHLMDRLAAADVTVNDDFGTWDPEAAQVIPPGGLPEVPGAGGAPGGP